MKLTGINQYSIGDDLVRSLSAGEEEGIRIFYDRFSPLLYGLLYRISGNEKLAGELLADLFPVVIKKFFTPPVLRNITLWDIIIFTRNYGLADMRQTGHHLDGHKLTENGNHPVDRILIPEYRKIIEMFFFNGYSLEESSSIQKLPAGIVRARTRAAILRIRKFFEQESVA